MFSDSEKSKKNELHQETTKDDIKYKTFEVTKEKN